MVSCISTASFAADSETYHKYIAVGCPDVAEPAVPGMQRNPATGGELGEAFS
jgi:hypothetical protein